MINMHWECFETVCAETTVGINLARDYIMMTSVSNLQSSIIYIKSIVKNTDKTFCEHASKTERFISKTVEVNITK